MIFVVKKSSRHQILRHTLNGHMVVLPDNTTLAHNFLGMSTSHFMKQQKEVSWNPVASLLEKNVVIHTNAALLIVRVLRLLAAQTLRILGPSLHQCIIKQPLLFPLSLFRNFPLKFCHERNSGVI